MSIKTARNKRLHVELALIKLCYLQQVIDLAVSPEGKVMKKRRLDGPVAVREKPVSPLLLKVRPAQEAQLKVETPPSVPAARPAPAAPTPPPVSNQAPETPVAQTPPATGEVTRSAIPPPPVTRNSGKKVDLLTALKQARQQDNESRPEARPVSVPHLEGIQEVWDGYIEKLKQSQRPPMIVTSFQIAGLSVEGNQVTVRNSSKINQKVIEGEASEVLSLFKSFFNNPDITLRFEVAENEEDRNKVVEPRYLNSQERFRLMASEYPAVQELKEKLKLDLGY
jgi:DNA polymerase-3 subunit gamma/tau